MTITLREVVIVGFKDGTFIIIFLIENVILYQVLVWSVRVIVCVSVLNLIRVTKFVISHHNEALLKADDQHVHLLVLTFMFILYVMVLQMLPVTSSIELCGDLDQVIVNFQCLI